MSKVPLVYTLKTIPQSGGGHGVTLRYRGDEMLYCNYHETDPGAPPPGQSYRLLNLTALQPGVRKAIEQIVFGETKEAE